MTLYLWSSSIVHSSYSANPFCLHEALSAESRSAKYWYGPSFVSSLQRTHCIPGAYIFAAAATQRRKQRSTLMYKESLLHMGSVAMRRDTQATKSTP